MRDGSISPTDPEDQSSLTGPFKRERGRSPKGIDYMGLAKAKIEVNKLLEKREKELEHRRAVSLKDLSSTEFYRGMGLDLGSAVESIRQTPTADISNPAKKEMQEVLIIAKKSKNLKGDLVRDLKNAALSTAAAVEVLCSRADNPEDSDIPRQIKSLKEELDKTKLEAAKAEKEISELKEEITKLRSNKKKKMRERTNVIVSNSSNSDLDDLPGRPKRERIKKSKVKHNNEEREDGQDTGKTEMVMDIDRESHTLPLEPAQNRIYCDEARKKEILPPREEWPP